MCCPRTIVLPPVLPCCHDHPSLLYSDVHKVPLVYDPPGGPRTLLHARGSYDGAGHREECSVVCKAHAVQSKVVRVVRRWRVWFWSRVVPRIWSVACESCMACSLRRKRGAEVLQKLPVSKHSIEKCATARDSLRGCPTQVELAARLLLSRQCCKVAACGV